MKSKAEIIQEHLKGLRVLDIGGSGYGEDNAYERGIAAAWSLCKERVTADYSPEAEITIDLNTLPLPECTDRFDVVTAFDVLEHLEHPVDVLRWVPSDRLLVTLPNALSWFTRRIEEKFAAKHLFSFTPYTASIMLGEGGWAVKKIEFQFGKWSMLAKTINCIGSLIPSYVGTGIVLHCERSENTQQWKLR